MASRLAAAKFIQIGFWTTGITFLGVVYRGAGGIGGMALALAATMPFVLTVMAMKCRKCGVSYFFDPGINSWNISGVNLLKPVKSRCPNCGADGAER